MAMHRALSTPQSPWNVARDSDTIINCAACACCKSRGACSTCWVRPGRVQHPCVAQAVETSQLPHTDLLSEVHALRREREELRRLVIAQEAELAEPQFSAMRGAHAKHCYGRGGGLQISSLERRLEHERLIAAQESTSTQKTLSKRTAPVSCVTAASAAATARQGAEAAELAALEVANAQALRQCHAPQAAPWRPPGLVSPSLDNETIGLRRPMSGRRGPLASPCRTPGLQPSCSLDPEVLAREQLDDAICALSSARGALTGAARQLSMNAQMQSAEAWRAHRKSSDAAKHISEEAWRMHKLEQAMSASAKSFDRHLRALSADRPTTQSLRRPRCRRSAPGVRVCG